MIIYEIRNKINDKSYIGYSTKFNSNEDFQNGDYWGSGVYIKNAIEKYGIDNFERKILIKNITNKTEIKNYEKIWIKKKNSHWTTGGYNLTFGGDGLVGYECSEDLKLKHSKIAKEKGIGLWMKGKRHTQTTKIKISNGLIGRFCSEETRKKLSLAKKGENHPMFGRTKENCPFYGKHHTEEARKKISMAQQGTKKPQCGSPGEKHYNFGKHLSKETKEKISQKAKERWENKRRAKSV